MTATFARERAYLSNARAFGRRWRDYLGFLCVAAVVVVALLVVAVLAVQSRRRRGGVIIDAGGTRGSGSDRHP